MKLILIAFIMLWHSYLLGQGTFAGKYDHLIGKSEKDKLNVDDYTSYQFMFLDENYFISCLADDSNQILVIIEALGKSSKTIVDVIHYEIPKGYDIAMGNCGVNEENPNIIAITKLLSEEDEKAIKAWIFNPVKRRFEYFDHKKVTCFKIQSKE
jgi:hypothetical protein